MVRLASLAGRLEVAAAPRDVSRFDGGVERTNAQLRELGLDGKLDEGGAVGEAVAAEVVDEANVRTRRLRR